MDCIEQLETKLIKLQNDIELLQKRINLTDAEQRTSSMNSKSELKKNSLEMKQLRMQVEELQVRLKRQQLVDCKIMQEALREKCKEPDDFKANSAQDGIQMLDTRVLDLNSKCGNVSHSLKLLERTFNENEKLLKEMTDTCRQDGIPSEADCLQRMKYLESEQHKTIKNIEDCENAKEKMKAMLEYIRKKQRSHFVLLMDLKTKKLKMMKNDDKDLEEEQERHENSHREKEKEFEKIKKDIDLIKEATCCPSIDDIDSAFLEQKKIKEDLEELVKKAEKRLKGLKEEKKDLTSKRTLMIESDCMYPKRDGSISLAKSRLKEQEIRRKAAQKELERLNSASNRTNEVLQRLIIKMQPKVNKKEMDNKDIQHLTKQFENILMYTFPPSKHSFPTKSKRSSS